MSNNPEKRADQAFDILRTSQKQMDILVISISGAGVYVCLEVIKFIHEQGLEPNMLPKVAGMIFILAVLINFLSHAFSFWANTQEYLSCLHEIDNEMEDAIRRGKLASRFDNLVAITNYGCSLLMLAGLAVLCVYFLTSI